MRTVEIDADDLEQIMELLPEKLREKIKLKMSGKPPTGIEVIRRFIEQYNEENNLDGVVAYAASCLIVRLIRTVSDFEDAGKEMLNGNQMGQIVIDCMQKEIIAIRTAIDKLEAEENKNAHH